MLLSVFFWILALAFGELVLAVIVGRFLALGSKEPPRPETQPAPRMLKEEAQDRSEMGETAATAERDATSGALPTSDSERHGGRSSRRAVERVGVLRDRRPLADARL